METVKKTIAVVEDNADNRLLIEAMLGDIFALIEYESGMVALEGFQSHLPDLILLDISLPGMDGTTVLQHLRANERMTRVPVIALTAHAMRGDREKYIQAGFDDYISKPILDEKLLIMAIERLMPTNP